MLQHARAWASIPSVEASMQTIVSNDPATGRGPEAVARAAARAFEARFKTPPAWLVVAPGRVNLIGEHTDYNAGFVLPMAIERYTVMAAAPASAVSDGPRSPTLRVHSAALNASVDIPLDSPQRPGEPSWSNYVRGVVAGFQARGVSVPSLCASIESDVPLGAGLSSSAALEVATATLLEVVTGTTLDPLDKARLCQTAEHAFAGVPCGLMDQMVCVLAEQGGPLLIDCRSEVARVLSMADATVSILIANSNVRHSLAASAYALRRAECEQAARTLGVEALRDATPAMIDDARAALGPVVHRRARHVVTEDARTLEAARALEAGDWRTAGALFYESHRSLRDDYEVSCAELDVLVDAARELGERAGVFGARMTGGGFGGCTVTLAKRDQVDAIEHALGRMYERRTGRAMTGFTSRPARGAHALDAPGAAAPG
jgi:galactokinase